MTEFDGQRAGPRTAHSDGRACLHGLGIVFACARIMVGGHRRLSVVVRSLVHGLGLSSRAGGGLESRDFTVAETFELYRLPGIRSRATLERGHHRA